MTGETTLSNDVALDPCGVQSECPGIVGYGGAISVAIFVVIGIFVVTYVTFLKVEAT